jgi:tetratricopeptide (TPR) repeat protein
MASIETLMAEMLSHYEKKEYADAEKYADELLAVRPDFHRAWFLKGVILEETGKRAEAKRMFEKAGDLFTLWIRLALQLDDTDPERAIQYYGRALELEPGFNLALLNRGLLCEKTGRLDEARACFRKLSPGKEVFSKIVIPGGFMALLIGTGVLLLERGEKIISMFTFVSALVCLLWLRRDGTTALKMLLKKSKYR